MRRASSFEVRYLYKADWSILKKYINEDKVVNWSSIKRYRSIEMLANSKLIRVKIDFAINEFPEDHRLIPEVNK